MSKERNFKYYNQGYSIGVSMPKPMQEPTKKMMEKFSKGKYGAKYKIMLEGFALGVREREYLSRKLQLDKIKQQKRQDKSRGR